MIIHQCIIVDSGADVIVRNLQKILLIIPDQYEYGRGEIRFSPSKKPRLINTNWWFSSIPFGIEAQMNGFQFGGLCNRNLFLNSLQDGCRSRHYKFHAIVDKTALKQWHAVIYQDMNRRIDTPHLRTYRPEYNIVIRTKKPLPTIPPYKMQTVRPCIWDSRGQSSKLL